MTKIKRKATSTLAWATGRYGKRLGVGITVVCVVGMLPIPGSCLGIVAAVATGETFRLVGIKF